MATLLPIDEYFELLSLDPACIQGEIKKAYRQFSLRVDPDKHSARRQEVQNTAESVFKRLNNAYEILKDEVSRSLYDRNVYRQLRKSRIGLSKRNAFDIFMAMKEAHSNRNNDRPQARNPSTQSGHKQNTPGSQRAEQQQADAEDTAQQQWRQQEKRRKAREAREARKRQEEEARARAAQEQKCREELEEAVRMRERTRRIERKWAKISGSFDQRILALERNIAVISDTVNDFWTSERIFLRNRGIFNCGWHGCFDSECGRSQKWEE